MKFFWIVVLMAAPSARAGSVGAFRAEIDQAQKAYILASHESWDGKGWPPHTQQECSQLISAEYTVLDPEISRDGHVFYLASGPDVFRNVYNFPLAKHYHYVDLLIGWGENPAVIIEEFQSMVEALAPTIRLSVLQRGFLDFFSSDELKSRKLFREKGRRDRRFREPWILRAQWVSDALGPQERFFYFHPLDVYRKKEIVELAHSVDPSETIAGIMTHGLAGNFDYRWQPLFSRLCPGGNYIRSDWKSNKGRFYDRFFGRERFRRWLGRDYDTLVVPNPPEHIRNGFLTFYQYFENTIFTKGSQNFR